MTKKSLPGQELIFGVHSLLEVLKAKRRKVMAVYTTRPTPKAWELVEPLLPKYLQVHYVDKGALERMSSTQDHQNLLAYVQPFSFQKKFFDPQHHSFVVMLDSIQDVRNVGAIIRSAYCTGVDGIILVSKHGAPLSGAAFKASAGLAEHIPVFLASSSGAAVQMLRNAGYLLYAGLLKGQNALEVSYKKPLCLIIGNEAKGITKEISSQCIPITLPQQSVDCSYNASVAAGILMVVIKNS